AANRQITNPNLIHPGQTVTLPAGAAEGRGAVQAEAAASHTVRGGDTLSGIAQQYGMSWRELAADNGIANPSRIQVGQQIRLNGAAPEMATPASEPAAEATAAGQEGVNPNLGALSARYETGGRGPGTVSSGS